MGARRRPARRAGAAGARRREPRRARRRRRGALVEDLADAEIVGRPGRAADIETFDARTVALLNRGVPELRRRHRRHPAHVADELVHRLAVGCGSTRPRRTAPDGSNFQLQHWTHTFDYALVSGDGDWRSADIPARSAEFSTRCSAVAGNTSGRRWPARLGSLLGIEPAGARATRRAQGGRQPDCAAGSAEPVDPAEASPCGWSKHRARTTDVAITSGAAQGVSAAARSICWSSRASRSTRSTI